MLKKFIDNILNFDLEAKKLREFFEIHCGKEERVLDVGCGYGRNLASLTQTGYDVTGVEVNDAIVADNKIKGFKCLSASEFNESRETYDIILMSHIVEHFSPKNLLEFVDSYLIRLKRGGQLIIATPLMSEYFYDDFDHVKPYHPRSFLMVFGSRLEQVQYRAKHELTLTDLWFRKSPFRTKYKRAHYMRGPATKVYLALDLLSALLFRLSFGFIGKKDGWIGVFKKVA